MIPALGEDGDVDDHPDLARGIGRENAAAAIESYSQTKSVYVGLGPVDSPY